MKKPGALRPQTSYLLAFLALAASGLLAGAALAGGLPPVLPTSVGLTTPAPPTVSATTPVATTTLSVPTVSTPAVTTPTASTPTVTTPTVSTPTVTTPVVTAPPVPAAPAPVVNGVVHAITTGSTRIVRAAATREVPVPVRTVTTSSVALPTSTPAPDVIAVDVAGTGSTVPIRVDGAASLPRAQPDGLSASPLQANDLIADGAKGVLAGTVLRSPLVAPLVAGAANSSGSSAPPPQPRGGPTPDTAGWSSIGSDPVTVAGGLALLVALLGLGAAGAARSSSAFAATCAELGRFPFPRFRILPCDRFAGARATDASTLVAVRSAGSGDGAAAGRRLVPRIAHVLGAQARGFGAPAMRAWELLKTTVLTILAAANGLLLAIRWQLGRWQSR